MPSTMLTKTGLQLRDPDRCVVLVSGSNDYNNPRKVFETLDNIHSKHHITAMVYDIHDNSEDPAKQWAANKGITVNPYLDMWQDSEYQEVRNQLMLDAELPDLVVVFAYERKPTQDCDTNTFEVYKDMKQRALDNNYVVRSIMVGELLLALPAVAPDSFIALVIRST